VPEQAIVVIDAGTSTIRCHVFSTDGAELAAGHTPWPPSISPADLPLAREWNPALVLSAVYGLIKRVLGEVEGAVEPVAVAVTSMRQGVAFLDSQNRALYLGPNIDLRAVFEGAAIDEDNRDLVYRATGHLPSFFFTPAKLAWFRGNRPELFERTSAAVTIPDWLILQLTRELASEPTLAGEAGLLNVKTRQWATALLDTLGLPLDSSVQLNDAGTTVGLVTSEAAEATGLPAGILVCSAGADTQCAALGLGVTEPGQVAIVAGWSAPVQQVTASPALSLKKATWAGCHLVGDRWVAESSAGDTGRAYSWISEFTGHSFDQLQALAESIEPGSEGTTAVLGPPKMDMSSVSLRTGGMLFPVPMTMNERGPGHLARAGLESAAYSIKTNLTQLNEVTERASLTISLGAGMAQSSLFCDILANVLDADILVLGHRSASAAGGFVCAMTALGAYDSLSQGAGRWFQEMSRVSPSALIASEYEDHYERWLEASSALSALQL
jgi:sugar (pentulose or hexulose) kinase